MQNTFNYNFNIPLFKSKPPNNILNNITKLLNKLATPISLKSIPIHRHMLAAVRLNKTSTSKNLKNSAVPSTNPTI
jgi:hypothetical protein